VGVGVGGANCAQYLPPVFRLFRSPPQMIISLRVQTAVWKFRASGALVMLVVLQLSVPGSYRPPLFRSMEIKSNPPQTIISLPVHTVVCWDRPTGALVRLVAVQLSVLGSYLPPVL
jgi:hypothetical protein